MLVALGPVSAVRDPSLCLAAAWVAAAGGAPPAEFEPWLAAVGAQVGGAPLLFGTGNVLVETALVRVASPRDDVGAQLAAATELTRLVDDLPDGPTSPVVRTIAAAALGYALFLSGRAAEARDTLARVSPAAAGVAPAATMLAAAIRSLACARLQLHGEAAASARSSAAIADRYDLRGSRGAALVDIATADVLQRSGDSETAVELLESARDRSEADPLVHVFATLSLAAAHTARDPDAARALAAAAQAAVDRLPDAGMLVQLAREVERLLGRPECDREPRPDLLGEAELRVLRLLPTAMTQREIARELYLSLNTVKTHARAIYRKLGVSSRADAVAVARRLKLV
jgi:LuxR family maltose regulon positive regulatory protein